MRRRQRWRPYPSQPELVRDVSRRHQVPELVAQILLNRGLAQAGEIDSFLDPSLNRLLPPGGLQDLPSAAARLVQALEKGETIAIYGDYDVDGLTATALLRHFLESLGAAVISYIPNRLNQGYGLHESALSELARRAQVVVTVDCGISNASEARVARDLGLDVIITDHHEVPATLPPAIAILNPKRPDCGYAFKELAGVGVALNLALGLRAYLREIGWFGRRPEPNLKAYLDLVALGTAADVVPLAGVNRILVSQGLKVLAKSRRPGIEALKAVTHLEDRPVSLREVVFRLAPRLNAAGRMGQAQAALELLLTEDRDKARQLAGALDRLNRERQSLEAKIIRDAEAQILQQGFGNRPALVLVGEDWHPGVIGIVAAKLAERFFRPVALLTLKNGVGRGSARSVEAFDLYKGLTSCQEHLLQFGGHAAAAGFTLAPDRVGDFRQAFEATVLQELGSEPKRPELAVDAVVTLAELDDEFFFHLDRLRPFGQGNPEPVLACLSAQLVDSWVVGEKHLKLKLASEGRIMTAIAFDQASLHPLRGCYDVAFGTRLNFFQGRNQPELRVLDLGKAVS